MICDVLALALSLRVLRPQTKAATLTIPPHAAKMIAITRKNSGHSILDHTMFML